MSEALPAGRSGPHVGREEVGRFRPPWMPQAPSVGASTSPPCLTQYRPNPQRLPLSLVQATHNASLSRGYDPPTTPHSGPARMPHSVCLSQPQPTHKASLRRSLPHTKPSLRRSEPPSPHTEALTRSHPALTQSPHAVAAPSPPRSTTGAALPNGSRLEGGAAAA